MGDWWIDESHPVGPSEFDGATPPRTSWAGVTVSWSYKDSDPVGDFKAFVARLKATPIRIRPAWQPHVKASAGTHSGGGSIVFQGKHYIMSYYDEAVNITSAACYDPVFQPREPKPKPPPVPNRDKGRVNNTGPRRGQSFGRGGRKRY